MSTIKSDSIQPTLGTNNLILRTGSADVERVRISPTGTLTVATETSVVFNGGLTLGGPVNMNGKLGIGSAYGGTPVADLEIVSTNNSSLLDPQFNTFNTTRNRANASIRASAGNTTLFFGNSGISAAWLQVQNSDNTQRSLALNPVGGNVGIGTTGPTVTLDVVGSGKFTNFANGNIAPLPTSSSGVGQVAHINTATAGTYTLPSDGTWFYFAFRWNTTSVQDSVSGIAAGGTLICSSFAGQAWEGFAWRIA